MTKLRVAKIESGVTGPDFVAGLIVEEGKSSL